MQVFKAFMKVLKKKMIYAVIYVGIFLSISISASLNSGNGTSSQEMFKKEAKSSVAVCIFDEDDTSESRAFVKYISDKYRVKKLENDDEVIMDSLYCMSVDSVMTVEKGFSQKLADGDTENIIISKYMHNSIHNVLIENDINSYFSAVSAYIAGGEDSLSASEKASEAMKTEADVNILSFDKDGNEEYPSDFSTYFRYMAYILISAVIGTLCPVLMAMNKKEIRYRTNCSSIAPSSYVRQIFLGSALFVIGIWIVFMIAGMVIYGGIYSGRAWLAVLNSFILAMVAVSIAVLISTFNVSSNSLNFINQIISLGMCFLCGVFVEQELMTEKVLAFSRFLPAYWYIKANDMLIGRELFDTSKLAAYMMIEAGFAAAIAAVTLLITKTSYSSSHASSKVAKVSAA